MRPELLSENFLFFLGTSTSFIVVFRNRTQTTEQERARLLYYFV